jgi:hypothetical protein
MLDVVECIAVVRRRVDENGGGLSVELLLAVGRVKVRARFYHIV